MTTEKQNYAVLSRFQSAYKAKTKRSLDLNKYKEKWAAQDLIDSFGYDRVLLAIDYFFKVGDKTSWTWFVKNCGNVLTYYDNVQKDSEERLERRRQMEEWLR